MAFSTAGRNTTCHTPVHHDVSSSSPRQARITLPNLLGYSDLVGEKCLDGPPRYVWVTFYEKARMNGSTPGQFLPVNYRWLQAFDLLLELLLVVFPFLFINIVHEAEDAMQSPEGSLANGIPWKSTDKCIQLLLNTICTIRVGVKFNPVQVNRPDTSTLGSEQTIIVIVTSSK